MTTHKVICWTLALSIFCISHSQAQEELSIPIFDDVTSISGMENRLGAIFGNSALADLNNDNNIDILIPHHGAAPEIYISRGDGTFSKLGAGTALGSAFSQGHKDFHGFSFADYNNDGITDMFITMGAKRGDPEFSKIDLLYEGLGDGRFNYRTDVAGVTNPTGRGRAACWFDYNGDGDLDLLVKNIQTPNAMFINNGDDTFYDDAEALALKDVLEGFNCTIVDFDNDGSLDIFLNGGGSTNYLLRQLDDGTFSNVSETAGLPENEFTRAAAWADYDQDGDQDLYLATGVPTGYEGPNSNIDLSNALYQNQGDGTFVDVTESMGLTSTINSWMALWGDVNNDGFLDLFVTNAGEFNGEGNQNLLYINDQNGGFVDSASEAGIDGNENSKDYKYTNASFADLNNDGTLDLLLGAGLGRVSGYKKVFYNQKNSNNYLKIDLKGLGGNEDGFGSNVAVTTAENTQTEQYTGTANGTRNSQNSIPMHFGLGENTQVAIDIDWPEGARVNSQSLENIGVNQTITIEEGTAIVRGRTKNPMNQFGCYIWREYSGWTMRCVAGTEFRSNWKGTITVEDGTITELNKFSFEANDELSYDGQQISFNLFARGGQDVINFKTTGTQVTFDFTHNNEYAPEQIRIGKFEVKPASFPLTLTE